MRADFTILTGTVCRRYTIANLKGKSSIRHASNGLPGRSASQRFCLVVIWNRERRAVLTRRISTFIYDSKLRLISRMEREQKSTGTLSYLNNILDRRSRINHENANWIFKHNINIRYNIWISFQLKLYENLEQRFVICRIYEVRIN